MMKCRQILRSGAACLLLTSLVSVASYGQDEGALARKEIEDLRREQQKAYRDKKASPLLPADRRKFKGLNYYPIDLKYRVTANFVRTENQELFKMKTTTSRLPEYVKYGEVHFKIDSVELKLEVYQSPEIMKRPGYEDYLFIPFTDLTNGHETYEVGRYIELRIPKDERVIVDFNRAYNPYCSYNPKFSCPIPPEPNQLPIAIRAGEKKFKESH